jgi:hypothetical protein
MGHWRHRAFVTGSGDWLEDIFRYATCQANRAGSAGNGVHCPQEWLFSAANVR